MNYRLLKYNLINFNYKTKKKAYQNRFFGRLLANYFLNEYSIEHFVKVLKYYSNKNFFKHLFEDFPKEYYILQEKYNLNLSSKNRIHLFYLINNNENYCLECNKRILTNNSFCSIKCSNLNRSKDILYKEKLKNSIKESYNKISEENKIIKNNKISNSVKNKCSFMSKEEKSNLFSNNEFKSFKFLNFEKKFPNLILNCNEDYFYQNKYLPVECKICGNKWNFTKSTSYAKTECRICVPYEKHISQNEIFNFVSLYNNCEINLKNIIYPKELDIYCGNNTSGKFAIEYNGLMYHSEGNSELKMFKNKHKNYHLDKTNSCEEKNIQLFHIFENEWLDENKKNIWKSVLLSKMNKTNKIFARKCTIKEVKSEEAKKFENKNHLQGSSTSSIRIGLYYENELVSLMTFGKARFSKQYEYELIRFCSKLNNTIVGGASKLLKYFEKTYNPKSLVSYANRRWSTGHLYQTLGFNFLHNSTPNYFYFKSINKLLSRNKFQKHKLESILENFNKNISESENMFNNNYRRIFDSGNKVFFKKYK